MLDISLLRGLNLPASTIVLASLAFSHMEAAHVTESC